MRQRQFTAPRLKKTMKEFEATCVLSAVSTRRRKPVVLETQAFVLLEVQEPKIESTIGSCSNHDITRKMKLSFSTVQNVIRKILHYYLYKIRCVHKIQCKWNVFHWKSLHEWRSIMLAFETSRGTMRPLTHKTRIQTQEKLVHETPLHSHKVIVCWGCY